MSMIEEKIRRNRDLFDGAEPGDGHFARFQSKLDSMHGEIKAPRQWYSMRLLRVAAVIALLLGLSVMYYLFNPAANTNPVAASTLPQEIQEARMYYAKITEEKILKINECASSTSEASYIQKIVMDEITLLDSSSLAIENELQQDAGNQRLINALIRNYKTKSDLLDDILNRLCHI